MDVPLVVIERTPLVRPVLRDHLLHLRHQQPFARRPALVMAKVLVGVELPLHAVDSHLGPVDGNDFSLSVFQLRAFGD